jgi:polyisoprenyl-teichoic acid--peptidoglycan teichoic acid transferase
MAKKTKSRIYLIVGVVLLFLLGKLILSTASFLPFFFQLVFNKNIDLKHKDDEVNVLLLGIGGGTHDGPQLTDTIIFSSLNIKTNKINMVSIPRDLYVSDLKGKINKAYSDGEEKRKGGGLILSKAIVEKVLDQNIDYGIRIDFDGFVKAVDLLGGVDVSVDKSFDDYEYPITGKENELCGHKEEDIDALSTASSQLEAFPCRYKHIHFEKGINHMNGETALEYVRSRHASGDEGSDFARSNRQEKVIKAFKDKVFSLEFFTNPTKVINLYSIIKGSLDTDIKDTEFDDFIRLMAKMKTAKIKNTVLDTGDSQAKREGLLINPPTDEYNGAWVLIPRAGSNNFTEIHQYVRCVLVKDDCSLSKSD